MKDKKYIYLLKTPGNIYKIGVAKDVDQRMMNLQTGSTENITLVDKFLSEYPFKIESTLHRRYESLKIKGEWYELSEDNIKSFQHDCEQMEKSFKCLDEAGNPFI